MAQNNKVDIDDPTLRRAFIVKLVTEKYLQSSDFNGFPVRLLRDTATLNDDICNLIELRALDLVRGDEGHENPHIKVFPVDIAEIQLQKIAAKGLEHCCLYPTPEVLAAEVNPTDYADSPYSLELALGAAQLEFRSFALVSLEYYRNDPRFHYHVDDIHGSIVYDDAYFDQTAPATDRLVMSRFGFCHSQPDLKRAVAVLLRDLHKLEPEQQQHWKRHQLTGDFMLHPGFQESILGHWGSGVSIFDAFLEEKNQINIMSRLMGREPLFRSANKAHERPDGFGFLIRPTQKELRSFTLLLDQLLSDDLNADFFREIEKARRGTGTDGLPMTEKKGTIQLLQEWLENYVRLNDTEPKDTLLRILRKIRQLRQKPAHKVEKDVFDDKFFEDQRQLIMDAYEAVRLIRLILQNHRAVRDYKVPDWLQEARFWTH